MNQPPAQLPRTIWTCWLQGWDAAPAVCQASLASWRRQNPDWQVVALHDDKLGDVLPPAPVRAIQALQGPPEIRTNLLRLELLSRYGGVWADATTICARPLSSWLPAQMESGFFAFSFPPQIDRPLASWFMASIPGGTIPRFWRAACWAYWHGRTERHTYHWMHELFAVMCDTVPEFRHLWAATPKLPGQHPLHFAPEAAALFGPPDAAMHDLLAGDPPPVWKLTHKLPSAPDARSLFAHLCRLGAEGPILENHP